MKTPLYTGIDISHWNILAQGHDFGELKNLGIDFVMIKVGGYEDCKLYKDPCFEDYYQKAKEAGLYVGAYFYVDKFTNCAETALASAYFANIIKGKYFEFPIVLDAEEQDKDYLAANSFYAKLFGDILESLGYYVSVYGSDISVFKDQYEIDKLAEFDKWVARYGNEPEYVQSYGMWQAGKNLETGVFEKPVDYDYAYYDYPKIMKEKNLNN